MYHPAPALPSSPCQSACPVPVVFSEGRAAGAGKPPGFARSSPHFVFSRPVYTTAAGPPSLCKLIDSAEVCEKRGPACSTRQPGGSRPDPPTLGRRRPAWARQTVLRGLIASHPLDTNLAAITVGASLAPTAHSRAELGRRCKEGSPARAGRPSDGEQPRGRGALRRPCGHGERGGQDGAEHGADGRPEVSDGQR